MGIVAPVAERGGRAAGLTPRDILLTIRPCFEDYSYHQWTLQLQTVQGRRKASSNELAHSQRRLLSMNTSLKQSWIIILNSALSLVELIIANTDQSVCRDQCFHTHKCVHMSTSVCGADLTADGSPSITIHPYQGECV